MLFYAYIFQPEICAYVRQNKKQRRKSTLLQSDSRSDSIRYMRFHITVSSIESTSYRSISDFWHSSLCLLVDSRSLGSRSHAYCHATKRALARLLYRK